MRTQIKQEHLAHLEGVRSTISDAERQDLDQLETVVEKGLDTFWQVGSALREIRVRRLYRSQYPTFVEYCEKRWGITDRRARQLMSATEVIEELPPTVQQLVDGILSITGG
jgi:hypothetical protein